MGTKREVSSHIYRDVMLTASRAMYDVIIDKFSKTASQISILFQGFFFSIFIETLYRSFKHFHTILLDRTKCHGKGM